MCWKFFFFFILGCMTLNFLYLSFSTLHSSSLWRADTTFTKLNKPPFPIGPLSLLTPNPSNVFEINKSLQGVNRGFTVSEPPSLYHCLKQHGTLQQYFGLKPTNHERRLFYIIQRHSQFYY